MAEESLWPEDVKSTDQKLDLLRRESLNATRFQQVAQAKHAQMDGIIIGLQITVTLLAQLLPVQNREHLAMRLQQLAEELPGNPSLSHVSLPHLRDIIQHLRRSAREGAEFRFTLDDIPLP